MDLVNARADAVEARKNRLLLRTLDLAEAEVDWKPSREPRPRPQKHIDTLFRSCVELLVEYIDDVDSLWGIPEVIKVDFPSIFSSHHFRLTMISLLLSKFAMDWILILADCAFFAGWVLFPC